MKGEPCIRQDPIKGYKQIEEYLTTWKRLEQLKNYWGILKMTRNAKSKEFLYSKEFMLVLFN